MKRSKYLSTLLLTAGIATTASVSAQWLGPWGSENDLAAAWGLEPSTLDDPDEGPGETIDYSGTEQPFRMSVESGNQTKPRATAPLRPAPRMAPAPRPAAPAPIARAPIERRPLDRPGVDRPKSRTLPLPPPKPVAPAPRARAPYYAQRPPAPLQRRAPQRAERRAPAPRQYGGYRQPVAPMPYYMPQPLPMMRMPAARAPYPYYRR